MRNANMIFFLITTHLIIVVIGEITFTHDMALDSDYHMWWKFDDEDITVKVKVETKGWIGWGLSLNGMMRGADMVIGWVDSNGENHFHDRHADGNFQPSIDDHQDYKLLQMFESNGSTSYTFTRKLQLSDEQDISITQDTMRILWSWNSEDPISKTNIPKHTKKGARSTFLLDYGDRKRQPLPEQYKTFDINMNNFNLPGKDTIYQCKPYKLPDMGTKKQHLFQIDPIITPGNEGVVHHILLLECFYVHDNDIDLEHDCYTHNMPDSNCTSIVLYAWAIGAGPFYYPSNVGFSLNTRGDPKYLLLQVHYDNPEEKDNIVDSSGFRVYYTEELRDFDSTVLFLGIHPSSKYSQIIPQQQKNFTSYGFCRSKCIDTSGQKRWIFAAFLHSHLQGRKIVTRLVNEITGKEVKTIAEDLNYDFNFQEVRYLKEPIEILPGHRIDIDCTYETKDRQKPVVDGLGTEQEMCVAFLYIYPKLSLKTCYSESTNVNTWGKKNLGWDVDDNGVIKTAVIVGNNLYDNVPAYEPLLNAELWKNNETLIRSFEISGAEDSYRYMCWFANDTYDEGYFENKPRILLTVSIHNGSSNWNDTVSIHNGSSNSNDTVSTHNGSSTTNDIASTHNGSSNSNDTVSFGMKYSMSAFIILLLSYLAYSVSD